MKNAVFVLALSGAILFPSMAWADSSGTVGAGVRLDDNVFRLPNNVSNGQPRSDQVYSALAHGETELTPDDFIIDLTGDAAYDRYAHNSQLSNFSYQVSGELQRQPDATIGIYLLGKSRRQLSSFADSSAQQRNIQQYTDVSLKLTAPFAGDFRVVVQPSFASNVNQAPVLKASDYHRYGGGAGVGYFSPVGNSLALTFTHQQTDGLQPRLFVVNGVTANLPIDLSDDSVNLDLRYDVSPLTTIKMTASYLMRRDHSGLGHNLNGPVGEISVNYHPRESFSITGAFGRRLQTQDSLFIDSVRDIYAQATVRARLADRLDVSLLGSFDARTFVGDTASLTVGSGRSDRSFRIDGSLAYLVLDRVSLGVRGAHQGRNADLATADYSANIFEFTIRILFGSRK